VIDRVSIQNFQSLTDVRLRMGRFTALVGRSSSGKSAVVRALQLLAHNARGTSYVTEGQTIATVAADIGDVTVAVRRGKGTSEYVLRREDTAPEKFTKCSTSVPDEVSVAMGFAEVQGIDLNFAGQFDAPFLLRETGTTVAKVLGDLTQVNVLYEASREANRRRKEVGGKVKSAREERDRLKDALQQYRDLREHDQMLTSARESRASLAVQVQHRDDLLRAVERAERVAKATDLIAERQAALVTIDRAEIEVLAERAAQATAFRRAAEDATYHSDRLASIHEQQALPGVSVDEVASLLARQEQATALRAAADAADRHEEIAQEATALAAEHEARARELREQAQELLKDHGCPTCGREWEDAA